MIVTRARAWTAAAWATMALVTASYAGLLLRARWSGDEYITLALLRAGGWPAFRHWYLTWSPRLLSDVLYALYGMAVDATHRPLAGTCMALLWVLLAAACVLPALWCNTQRGARMLAGGALFCLFLTGHAVTEVFYWPGSGLSYVPTLAGMVWLFWCLADGLRNRIAACLALALIAGSSEVGVFLTLTVTGCLVVWRPAGGAPAGARQRSDRFFVPLFQRSDASLLWLSPGLVLALLDLALVLHGRVGTIEIIGLTGRYVHHAGPSLIAAAAVFARELVVPDSDANSTIEIAASAASRVLILLGARRAFRWVAPRGAGLLLPFAAALLLAAFASVAAGFYQFGELCCQRHDTMRACFVVMALVSLGGWSAGVWPVQDGRPAAPLWLAAILLLFAPRVPAMVADYAAIPGVLRARAQSWTSGLQAGEDMVFVLDPPGRLINGTGLPTGNFAMDRQPAWYDLGIMKFFGKKRLVIVAH